MAAWRQWRQLHQAGQLNALQDRFFQTRPVEELYDISKDPYETQNLAGDPKHRDRLLELRTSLSMETTQVLNMLTMLRDGLSKYEFKLVPEDVRTRGYFPDLCLVHLCSSAVPVKPDYLK